MAENVSRTICRAAVPPTPHFFYIKLRRVFSGSFFASIWSRDRVRFVNVLLPLRGAEFDTFFFSLSLVVSFSITYYVQALSVHCVLMFYHYRLNLNTNLSCLTTNCFAGNVTAAVKTDKKFLITHSLLFHFRKTSVRIIRPYFIYCRIGVWSLVSHPKGRKDVWEIFKCWGEYLHLLKRKKLHGAESFLRNW
jgi:hypothetical protein